MVLTFRRQPSACLYITLALPATSRILEAHAKARFHYQLYLFCHLASKYHRALLLHGASQYRTHHIHNILAPVQFNRITIMSDKTLSLRAQTVVQSAGENAIWDVLADLYHPTTNPNGFISLGVAENTLMHDELSSFISSNLNPLPHHMFTYGDGPTGSHALKASLAHFFNRKLHPHTPIKPEHISVTNGVSTVIENLSSALADPGDAFLLGRPYYRAFLSDVSLRPGTKVIPVSFGKIDPLSPAAASRYEDAIATAKRDGVTVKGLVLAHPHNPLGRSYPIETLEALMKLCNRHNIHFISDEIYAFSTFTNSSSSTDSTPTTPFTSAISLDPALLIRPHLLHMTWGISKDFSANGLRLGALVSQSSPTLHTYFTSVGLYTYPSSLSDLLVTRMLAPQNSGWVDRFIATNQRRLAEAHAFATALLRSYGIEYVAGVGAAFFLWIDLGSFYLARHPGVAGMYGRGTEGESKVTGLIYDRLMAEKVFLASGDATGAEEPGWFRLVFTQPREVVREGVERIVGALAGAGGEGEGEGKAVVVVGLDGKKKKGSSKL